MTPYPLTDLGRLRYAVLHHTGVDQPHYDLLFETRPESPLTAFRLPRWPAIPGDPAAPLPDHRPIYLSYQGPISRNRGHVRRVAAGTVRIWQSAVQWVLEHDATTARLSLIKAASGHWTVHEQAGFVFDDPTH